MCKVWSTRKQPRSTTEVYTMSDLAEENTTAALGRPSQAGFASRHQCSSESVSFLSVAAELREDGGDIARFGSLTSVQHPSLL
jgi:hypothetical protein